MQTIEISDAAYNRIMAQKIGRESISTTIIRLSKRYEMEFESGWDAEKLDADLNNSLKNMKRLYSHDEAFTKTRTEQLSPVRISTSTKKGTD